MAKAPQAGDKSKGTWMSEAGDIAGERPESLVVGDRLCLQCGFNLVGQLIAREEHYGLRIARCPECGTVASLQEYPLMGRWAGRLGALLAVAWFIVMFGGIALTAVWLWGSGEGAAFGTTVAADDQIEEQFHDFAEAIFAEDPTDPRIAPFVAPGPDTGEPRLSVSWRIDGAWLAAQTRESLGYEGFRLDRFSRRSLVDAATTSSVLFFAGMAWAIALPHRRWRGILVVIAVPVGLAVLGSVLSHVASKPSPSDTWVSAADAARYFLGPPVVAGCLMLGSVALVVGTLVGRPLARLAVRVMLPPRIRGPLAWLWICDGKPAPATRSALNTRG
ncbi:MAG: hypothetical protein AAF747_03445 [Planctomycetota bacterium]